MMMLMALEKNLTKVSFWHIQKQRKQNRFEGVRLLAGERFILRRGEKYPYRCGSQQ